MRRFGGFSGVRLGNLSDGTPVAVHPNGQVTDMQGNALAVPPVNAVPAAAGGGNVQGRGLDFQYQTPNVASIAPGASTSVTIQFDQNSVFNWLRTTYTADLLAALTTDTNILAQVTLQITDTGNGMSFMNAPIPVYALAGNTASLPYVLPTPQLIQANASYQFQWANYTTGGGANQTYSNLRLQMHGYRIFNIGTA